MDKFIIFVLTLIICGLTNASFNFIAIGDWGADPYRTHGYGLEAENEKEIAFGVDDQHRVAARMDQWAGENGIDAIITGGDNFYPDGVVSLDDPKWDDVWRNVYNSSNLENVDWWLSVGNHDHRIDGRCLYQVEYSDIEPRWHFPYLWYDHYFEKDDIRIHMIVLDSEILLFNWLNNLFNITREQQLEWINDTLANSDWTVDWTILVAHHPMRSCGRYAPGSLYLRENLADLFDMYDIDFYIDGHDHNMQHIIRNDTLGMDFVVTGGGGRGRYEIGLFCPILAEDGYSLEFFAERYGFTGFIVEKDTMTFTHYGDVLLGEELEELYSFTRFKSDKKNVHY